MKGIILAGGTGTRLYPLTKMTNKHLLPVGRYPMIVHAVAKLKQAGIQDVLIVTGRDHVGAMAGLLGGGEALGLRLTYKVQERAGGIAEALGLAEPFAQGEAVAVLLGDNIFEDSLAPFAERFRQEGNGGVVWLRQMENPQRYGVPDIQNGRIAAIEEKPEQPKSSYAVTGIYMYDCRVFDFIRNVRPSARGELEITDVNNAYIAANALSCEVLQGWWIDAGTFESLREANRLAADVRYGPEFDA